MIRRFALILVPLVLVACEKPSPRLNAPPHGQPQQVSIMRDMYDHMTDNALLADMSITDVHFLPHRALLNSLGEQRLCRLAALMEMYGGEIRFNSVARDEALVSARTETIVDFLQSQGIDIRREEIVFDLPAGPGMESAVAILIRANEGTYKPKKSDNKAGSLTGSAPNGK